MNTDPVMESAGVELIRLVKNNDIDSLRQRIQEMNSVDQADGKGRTAMHWASILCHLDCLKILIEAG